MVIVCGEWGVTAIRNTMLVNDCRCIYQERRNNFYFDMDNGKGKENFKKNKQHNTPRQGGWLR